MHDIKQLGSNSYSYGTDEWEEKFQTLAGACKMGHHSWHKTLRRRQLSPQHRREEEEADLVAKEASVEVDAATGFARHLGVLDTVTQMVDIIVKQTQALFDASFFVDDASKAKEALPVLVTRECNLLYKNNGLDTRSDLNGSFWRAWHMTESFEDPSKPLSHPCSS